MDFLNQQNLDIFWQLFVAVLLGSIVGIERSLVHKTAGMRTFALVSLGAAAFTMISVEVIKTVSGTPIDPTRIASQIIVGIGFLAGGIIFMNKEKVQGLTTSAGLWVSGAVGVAVGFHLYAIATIVALLTLVIFTF